MNRKRKTNNVNLYVMRNRGGSNWFKEHINTIHIRYTYTEMKRVHTFIHTRKYIYIYIHIQHIHTYMCLHTYLTIWRARIGQAISQV